MSETVADQRPRWLLPAAALATILGVATVVAGGRALLGSAVEGAVPFVLWFNFLAGFAYVVAGIALARARPWVARLALALAAGTALVYVLFGIHVLRGGTFSGNTVAAMALRTIVWSAIAGLTCRRFGCRRSLRTVATITIMTSLLVGVTTCGRPSDTVRVHAPAVTRATAARPPAPRMAVKDHRERLLELPVPGRVTMLSFASRSTADRGSERCRQVRVAHPEVEIVELMNASSVPSFLAGKVNSKLAERHQTILADTTQAFEAAHRTPPPDLEARIHIVADWNGDAFKAYGATNTDHEVDIAVIDSDGGIASFFATTPTAAELDAAVVHASGSAR